MHVFVEVDVFNLLFLVGIGLEAILKVPFMPFACENFVKIGMFFGIKIYLCLKYVFFDVLGFET
jgi:hypothetical protein